MAVKDQLEKPWHKEEERQRRFGLGIDGVHLCTPFQCEQCWMRNLEGRDPNTVEDKCFLACIRRANLNAILGKAPMTILNHLRKTKAAIKNAKLINKTLPYHLRGPFPLADTVSMGLAVDMLVKLLVAKGRLQDHVQYPTLRCLRATFTKNWELHP